MRIDHVAIAVNNVDQALKNYEKLMRVDKVHIESVANEKVKVAILELQDTRIELMEWNLLLRTVQLINFFCKTEKDYITSPLLQTI